MNMLVSTAAISAAAAPLTQSTQDPIFALIEAHKKTNAEYAQAVSVIVDGTVSPDEEKEEYFGDRERCACHDLASTTPTTLSGLLALLTYVTDVHTGKFSSGGRPDLAFGDDDLFNIVIGAEECLQAHFDATQS